MKKLKMLMLGFSGKIGLTYHLTRLAVGLKRQGVDVVVYTTDKEQVKGLKKELEEEGVKYYEGKFLDKKTKPGIYYRAVQEISRIVKSENIDIIYTHGFLIPIYIASRPPIVRSKVPVVTTVNSFPHNTKTETFVCMLESKLANLCPEVVMSVSEQLKQDLINFGVKPEKLRVVHWGIDLQKFEHDISNHEYLSKCASMFENMRGQIVVQSAMLYHWKGTEYYLKAAPAVLRAFPETKFLIVGDGPVRSELEKLSYSLGITENVVFIGEVEGDAVPMILSHADIGVVPSLRETFSIALIELMAAGKPVIATPVGVAPEIITPGNDIGYIVPHKDPDALAEAIIKLLSDPAKAMEMGRRGRKLVEEKFTMDVMAGRIKEVCAMAIEGKSPNQRRIL